MQLPSETSNDRNDSKILIILVGIDYYLPGEKVLNKDNESVTICDLRGAVADVVALERHIQNHTGLKGAQVFTLSSSKPEKGKLDPPGKPESWATHANIVKLFEEVTKQATSNDIIHIHFSCHGVRVRTNYPKHKDQDGFDEAIAPMDFRKTGKCLRDVELNVLLRRMVKRGAHVSIICDCCHSGSVTRGEEDGAVRAIEDVHAITTEMHDSIPQDDEELAKVLEGFLDSSTQSTTREIWSGPGGFDMFAACHLDKKSEESPFDGKWHGLFTGNLLAILRNQTATFTHGHLQQRLEAQLRDRQMPIFSGNRDRHFLMRTTNEGNQVPSLSVIRVNRNHVTLSEGSIQGVKKGSTYAHYPWWETDFTNRATKPRLVITDVGENEARAEWEKPATYDTIEVGSLAVLVTYKPDKLRVRIPSRNQFSKLQSLSYFIKEDKDSGVVEQNDGSSDATYHIGLNKEEDYQLQSTDNTPIPEFPTSSEEGKFLRSLSHLSRYEVLRDLRSANPSRSLRDGYEITIKNSDTTWDKHQIQSSQQIDLLPGKVHVNFRNTSEKKVFVTVFAFTAQWAAKQIYPSPRGGEMYGECEPGSTLEMRFPLNVAPEWPAGVDYINYLKFFVVESGLNFRSVHLEDLKAVLRGQDEDNWGEKGLQEILAELGMPTRTFGDDENTNKIPWLTFNVKTRVV